MNATSPAISTPQSSGTGSRQSPAEPRGRSSFGDLFLDWFAAIGTTGPAEPFSPPGGIDAYRGAPWFDWAATC